MGDRKGPRYVLSCRVFATRKYEHDDKNDVPNDDLVAAVQVLSDNLPDPIDSQDLYECVRVDHQTSLHFSAAVNE